MRAHSMSCLHFFLFPLLILSFCLSPLNPSSPVPLLAAFYPLVLIFLDTTCSSLNSSLVSTWTQLWRKQAWAILRILHAGRSAEILGKKSAWELERQVSQVSLWWKTFLEFTLPWTTKTQLWACTMKYITLHNEHMIVKKLAYSQGKKTKPLPMWIFRLEV